MIKICVIQKKLKPFSRLGLPFVSYWPASLPWLFFSAKKQEYMKGICPMTFTQKDPGPSGVTWLDPETNGTIQVHGFAWGEKSQPYNEITSRVHTL